MNELVLPQSIQLPSSTIKHRREIYKICDFFSVITNKTKRILLTKVHEYTSQEGLDGARGGGGVGYKCQLSVKILAICQLSVKVLRFLSVVS